VAAGGLRRPPTKSPNRIPFGFRASLRRVNNVFTRRFGSFAVSASSLPLRRLSGPSWLYTLCSPRVFLSGPSSFFFLIVRLCPCAACGRPACCTFHGCLQLRIMNIDNAAGRGRDRRPFQCKYLGDLTGPRRSIPRERRFFLLRI